MSWGDGDMVWPLGHEPQTRRSSQVDPFGPDPFGAPLIETSKPWLALRDGETRAQWQVRQSNTCQRCGHYEEGSQVLGRHEKEHGDE